MTATGAAASCGAEKSARESAAVAAEYAVAYTKGFRTRYFTTERMLMSGAAGAGLEGRLKSALEISGKLRAPRMMRKLMRVAALRRRCEGAASEDVFLEKQHA